MGKQIRQYAIALFAALIAWTFVTQPSARAQTIAEAIDATNLVWTTGGDAVWFGQSTNTHDGVDAVSISGLNSNQMGRIETTVIGPATVSFWELVSPARWSSYVMSFTVNGGWPAQSASQMIVLNNPWRQWTYDLSAGTNILRWSVSSQVDNTGQSLASLDEFNFGPPRPLAFTYEPSDRTVYAGELSSYGGYGSSGALLFSGSVIGTPPFQYQWRKDSTNLPGANSPWLSFTNVTQADAGNYSLVVSNSQGFIVSTNALLTVLPPTAPFFTYEPGSVTAYTGQTLYLSGAVDGSQPFTFQWRKDSTNLPGANSSWLTLTNLSLAEAGSYTLFVTNYQGNVESSNAVLTVIQSVAPVITRHPRSLEVAEGVNTWMSVEAIGTPDPCIVWKMVEDGPPEPPPGPPLPPLPMLCHHDPHRSFNNVTVTNAGVYFAAVTNVAGGGVSRDALLTVLPPLSLKSSWGQGAEDVFVSNGLAFLAQGADGLAILSVSNPASPQFLGSCDTPGSALAVEAFGGLAFIADGTRGLQIISVTNPSNPILVGSYNTPGYANDVVVRSNLAFVADGSSGLQILNVSNPASPSLVGSYSTNLSPRHLALSGNLVFLTSLQPTIIIGGSNYWVGGMLVVDVSDPMQPTELGRWGNSVGSVSACDSVAFAGVSVLSVTNPAQPVVISSCTYTHNLSTNYPHAFISGTAAVREANGYLYLVGSYANQMELLVYDVRDPVEPIPVGYFAAPTNYAGSLWVDGNYVYIGGYNMPLLIIETPFNTQPATPPSLSLATQNGLELRIKGRRGLHYDVEYADSLTGFPWQPFHTVLLTNESAVVEVPSETATRFFRLRQLD